MEQNPQNPQRPTAQPQFDRTISKIGHSLYVCIPARLARALDLAQGDTVRIIQTTPTSFSASLVLRGPDHARR